ncbi:MAG: reverse transcriptase family protein [Armatimonadota bacterium]|jgi:retron-type reverse transcriptase
MGIGEFFRRILGGEDEGRGVNDLAYRLGMSEEELRAATIAYREFTVPKRSGGTRRIAAPEPDLKLLQRRILRRVLARLKCHPAATGFERGHSIVTNALSHVGRAVVIRMDLADFFGATRDRRVRDYFRAIGYNREASDLITRLCSYRGGLPQGAPTSPRLSNLVNYRLDARLAGLAERLGAAYTRYADDMTFSFPTDDRDAIGAVLGMTKYIARQEGYRLHMRRKLHIRRRHRQQLVTGLVVNESVKLPRRTRRWLRAVEHRAATGRRPTLSAEQLAGWRSLQSMIASQTRAPD